MIKEPLIPTVGVITDVRLDTPDIKTFRVVTPDGKKAFEKAIDAYSRSIGMKFGIGYITLEDGEIHADAISYASETDKKQVGIEIHSGKNRIVRRIFESLGYHVVKLDRVYFAGLTKKDLPRGRWRYLTQDEVNFLKQGSFE